MSSESDTPDAGGARSGDQRAPRKAPATSAAATSSAAPRKPVKRTPAAAKTTAARTTAPKTTAAKTAAARAATAKAADPTTVPDAQAAPEATQPPEATRPPEAATTAPAAKAPAKKPASPRKPVQRKPASGATTPAAPRTPSKPRTPARRPAQRSAPASVVRDLDPNRISLSISGLTKKFGSTTAVAGIDIDVPQGSFYGIVGPNGAGKTTTLSMATGLLRPGGGSITVFGHDVWRDPAAAKRLIGVLPDRLRLFDRLTGRQLLHYSGTLRGLDSATVRQRADDLTVAFGLEDAINRLVSDYSVGMTKKIALASSMIHSPRILVLDEPFESVDPVSASNVVEILERYVAGGGTVVLSSHSMDMIQRVCDRVAIIVEGRVLAKGTVDEVREGGTLEERFIELAGGRKSAEGMEWLLSSSD
ncbi:ABC transporter ATP-binding protein [Herbiconiux flava]|uniref:ABC-2 type transport system ATP-binding protein n=1 Tax=Herbiconiux flava TaxID=881268 RepID=A0A852SSG2_9MICO|nr:ABC-2 type transport system ATP-binding protein [Herbiconiux flava]